MVHASAMLRKRQPSGEERSRRLVLDQDRTNLSSLGDSGASERHRESGSPQITASNTRPL